MINRSETETALALIWSEVLGVPVTDTTSSFISLGGDSLAAMLCISRMTSKFGKTISLEDFFTEDATIGHISTALDAND